MTDFNMPPGCRVSDIPGNRPEDLREEAFWELLEDKCREDNIRAPDPDNRQEDMLACLWIEIARKLEFDDGFEQGKQEGQMLEMARQEDREEQRLEASKDRGDTYRRNADGSVTLITASGGEHTFDPDQLRDAEEGRR